MQLIEASILWVQAPSPIPKASFTSIVCHYMQHWMEELAVGKTTSKRPYIFFLVSLPYYHWRGVALHDIIWHHPWSFSKGNPNQDRPWKMTVGRLNFPFGIAKFSGSTLDFQGVFTQNLELARSFGFPAIDLRCWSSWATQSRAEQWKVLFSFCLGSCTSHVDEYYSLGKSVKVPSMWRFMTYQEYIKKLKKKTLSKLKGRGKLKVDLLEGGWHCIPYPWIFQVCHVCHHGYPRGWALRRWPQSQEQKQLRDFLFRRSACHSRTWHDFDVISWYLSKFWQT